MIMCHQKHAQTSHVLSTSWAGCHLATQNAQQTPMFFANQNLKEHVFHVCNKVYLSFPKSGEDTNDLISQVSSNQKLTLIDLPAYSALQSNATRILLGFAG